MPLQTTQLSEPTERAHGSHRDVCRTGYVNTLRPQGAQPPAEVGGEQAASTAPRRALRPALHDGEQGGEPQGDSPRLYGVTGVSVEFLHGRESGEGGRARKAGRKGNVGCDLRPKESREPRPGPAVGSPPYRGRGVDLAISGPALVPDPGPRCRRPSHQRAELWCLDRGGGRAPSSPTRGRTGTPGRAMRTPPPAARARLGRAGPWGVGWRTRAG